MNGFKVSIIHRHTTQVSGTSLLLLLLLLAPVTYNQVQPLRMNYLASQFKPYA